MLGLSMMLFGLRSQWTKPSSWMPLKVWIYIIDWHNLLQAVSQCSRQSVWGMSVSFLVQVCQIDIDPIFPWGVWIPGLTLGRSHNTSGCLWGFSSVITYQRHLPNWGFLRDSFPVRTYYCLVAKCLFTKSESYNFHSLHDMVLLIHYFEHRSESALA